uniref:Uncharacterized protein n=1 Tax=Globodera rostochiensis TaxID=31243 RepID=A0A914H6Z9_GLORO
MPGLTLHSCHNWMAQLQTLDNGAYSIKTSYATEKKCQVCTDWSFCGVVQHSVCPCLLLICVRKKCSAGTTKCAQSVAQGFAAFVKENCCFVSATSARGTVVVAFTI